MNDYDIGYKEGFREGKIQQQIETTLTLIKERRYNDAQLMELTGISEELLQNLRTEIQRENMKKQRKDLLQTEEGLKKVIKFDHEIYVTSLLIKDGVYTRKEAISFIGLNEDQLLALNQNHNPYDFEPEDSRSNEISKEVIYEEDIAIAYRLVCGGKYSKNQAAILLNLDKTQQRVLRKAIHGKEVFELYLDLTRKLINEGKTDKDIMEFLEINQDILDMIKKRIQTEKKEQEFWENVEELHKLNSD
ncbi:MAG: hypothetical protein LUG21_08605 [Clostridiales bacterium]|nr:hypothetical protein [Clostridiales bacterium]